MAVGEMFGSKLVDLLVGGLQRSVSVVFQKLSRLQKVDNAIRNISIKNPAVVTALRDYEIIAGSYHGTLTVTLDAFLSELGQTGLIEAMAENALLNRDSPETKILFSEIYFRFFSGEVAAKAHDLYAGMMRAFVASLKELTKDPIIHMIVQASHKDIIARLDQIDESLISIMAGMSDGNPITFDSLLPSIIRISKGLQQSYKNVRIETNRGSRDVEINKIYIPPQLSLRNNAVNSKRISALLKPPSRGSVSASVFNASYFTRIGSDSLRGMSYQEFGESFRRVVVLGDPGGGKSTICQKLCYDMAKNTTLSLQFKNEPRLNPSRYKIPIRVILRKFEQARVADPQLDLLTYITRDTIHFAGGEANDIKQALEYLLDTGRAVLAFDGLDEILETSRRQDFVELVLALCNRYPLCPVIVTSRLVGYDDARLGDEFEEIVLEKFSEPEIKAYVKKFMAVVGGKPRQECDQLAQKFIDETAETAYDLRRNALLLGLMAWLFLANGDVPSNRPEIYKECSILLFEKWDQRRGIVASSTNDFDRSLLFIVLASKIYGQPKLAGGVNKNWLDAVLKEQFLALYENKARAYRATKDFVEFITGRAWVMTDVGNEIYSFTHQTFLEYFFARYLDDCYDGVGALLKALRPRINKNEWNEVAHLSLQLKTYRSLRKQEEAVAILATYIADGKVAKYQLAVMRFAARALEYLSPSEATVGRFIDLLFLVSFSRARSGDFSAVASIADCAFSARERREFVREKISAKLRAALIGEDAPEAEIAAIMLGGIAGADPLENDSDRSHLPRDLRVTLIEELRNHIVANAMSRPLFAGLSWAWYGYISDDLVQRHGVAPYFNHPRLDGIGRVNGLTAIALDSYGGFVGAQPGSLAASKIALAIIARQGLRQLPLARVPFKTRGLTLDPPMHVWVDIFRSLKNDHEALVGAIFVHRIGRQVLGRIHRAPLRLIKGPSVKLLFSELERLREHTDLAGALLSAIEGPDGSLIEPLQKELSILQVDPFEARPPQKTRFEVSEE